MVSAPALPAGLEATVKRAVYLWEFTPGACGGGPVATQVRIQLEWVAPGS
jgi:hypothetical protein